jgi:hypothetical protein
MEWIPDNDSRVKTKITAPESTFKNALRSVGVGLKKNLLWFLHFRALDLNQAHPDVIDTAWQELNALAIVATINDKREANLMTDQRRIHWLETALILGRLNPSPRHDEVVQSVVNIQQKVDTHIAEFLRLGFTLMHVPHLFFFVGKGRPGPELRNEFLPEVTGPVLYRLAVTLTKLGDHLSKCGACGRIFCGLRLKQRYCSARCRARIAMRDMRHRANARRSSNKPRGLLN